MLFICIICPHTSPLSFIQLWALLKSLPWGLAPTGTHTSPQASLTVTHLFFSVVSHILPLNLTSACLFPPLTPIHTLLHLQALSHEVTQHEVPLTLSSCFYGSFSDLPSLSAHPVSLSGFQLGLLSLLSEFLSLTFSHTLVLSGLSLGYLLFLSHMHTYTLTHTQAHPAPPTRSLGHVLQ